MTLEKKDREWIDAQIDELEALIDQAQDEVERLKEARRPFAAVVFVGDHSVDLRKQRAFAYYNGIGDALCLGDKVYAPTRYDPDAVGIVVRLSKDPLDDYDGPYKTITEWA